MLRIPIRTVGEIEEIETVEIDVIEIVGEIDEIDLIEIKEEGLHHQESALGVDKPDIGKKNDLFSEREEELLIDIEHDTI